MKSLRNKLRINGEYEGRFLNEFIRKEFIDFYLEKIRQDGAIVIFSDKKLTEINYVYSDMVNLNFALIDRNKLEPSVSNGMIYDLLPLGDAQNLTRGKRGFYIFRSEERGKVTDVKHFHPASAYLLARLDLSRNVLALTGATVEP